MKPFQNKRLLSALTGAKRVFLCTHIAPDGDAIGSLTAAAHVLAGMGKEVVACCADPVPKQYLPLPGAMDIVRPDQVTGAFDVAMSLDAADLARIGKSAEIYDRVPVRLQIDHHGTNPGYAMENEVDADAAAAGCIVMRMIKALGRPLDKDVAACLYTAISMDTGNFSYPNVDTEVFEIMAELTDTGFDLALWARHLHLFREPEYLGLLSRALSRITFLYGGRVTMTCVLPKDYEEEHALPEHSENIVNYGLYIPGVVLTCFVNQQAENVVRFSLRALPPYSAQNVAVQIGGGGHEAAAGATLNMPLDQAVQRARAAIDEEMKRH